MPRYSSLILNLQASRLPKINTLKLFWMLKGDLLSNLLWRKEGCPMFSTSNIMWIQLNSKALKLVEIHSGSWPSSVWKNWRPRQRTEEKSGHFFFKQLQRVSTSHSYFSLFVVLCTFVLVVMQHLFKGSICFFCFCLDTAMSYHTMPWYILYGHKPVFSSYNWGRCIWPFNL